tara:strand:- start:203 stop:460 length:258 start_codon:yes stop_codon:yes gene_type:complete
MKRITVKDNVKYLGGTQNGRLVRPSIANACISSNMPVCFTKPLLFEDYPMALDEQYKHKIIKTDNGDEKVVFKLTKSEKVEIRGF